MSEGEKQQGEHDQAEPSRIEDSRTSARLSKSRTHAELTLFPPGNNESVTRRESEQFILPIHEDDNTRPPFPIISVTAGDDRNLKQSKSNVSDAETTSLSTKRKKKIDFLLLVVHGIGHTQAILKQNREDFKTSLKCVIAHWFWELDVTIHVEFIDWKSPLLQRQRELFGTSAVGINSAADGVNSPSGFVMSALADLMCFMTPDLGDYILSTTAIALNNYVTGLLGMSHGRFRNSKIVLLGHSLGGVILHELLTGHKSRCLGTDNGTVPQLEFTVESVFLLGCPLTAFLCLRNQTTLPLPANVNVYNIYHSQDPIACRLEPMYYNKLDVVPAPVRLPYWKNNSCYPYVRWSKDVESSRQAVADYVSTAASHIKNFFSTQTTSDENVEHITVSTPSKDRVVKDIATAVAEPASDLSPRSVASSSSAVVLDNLSQAFVLKTMPDMRYGTHSRRPVPGYRPKPADLGMSLTVGAEELKPSKAATLRKLLTVLELDQNVADTELLPHLESASLDVVEVVNVGRKLDKKQMEEMLSEFESGSGLELPVRLDFQLQENMAEYYVAHIGSLQSHFNYWVSRDTALFIVKQITKFRPRILYPDFERVMEYAEKQKLPPQKSGGFLGAFASLGTSTHTSLASATVERPPLRRRPSSSAPPPPERNIPLLREQAKAFLG